MRSVVERSRRRFVCCSSAGPERTSAPAAQRQAWRTRARAARRATRGGVFRAVSLRAFLPIRVSVTSVCRLAATNACVGALATLHGHHAATDGSATIARDARYDGAKTRGRRKKRRGVVSRSATHRRRTFVPPPRFRTRFRGGGSLRSLRLPRKMFSEAFSEAPPLRRWRCLFRTRARRAASPSASRR